MSEGNVEVVRQVFAAWAEGDFSLAEPFDPDVQVEWVSPIFAQQSETTGIRETARHMREFLNAYEGVTATAERIIDAGDCVVVAARWHGSGKASGIEFPERSGTVWTISDGKVTRIANYRTPAEAFEAAGLSE